MKYFLDTEFIEFPNTIELISIGLVCEDGRKYYAICSDYNFEHANEWVVENVIKPIYEQTVPAVDRDRVSLESFHKFYGMSIDRIKSDILEFVGYPNYPTGKPEFWGYYADYDWVVFCWIFGSMSDLPEGFPMYCNDLKQWLSSLGLDNAPIQQPSNEHNALADAEWNFKLYEYLADLCRTEVQTKDLSFISKVLELIAEYDIFDVVFWNSDLEFFVICNDEFGPGSDAEQITEHDLISLRKYLESWEEDPVKGCFAWVASKRGYPATCYNCGYSLPFDAGVKIGEGKWLCDKCHTKSHQANNNSFFSLSIVTEGVYCSENCPFLFFDERAWCHLFKEELVVEEIDRVRRTSLCFAMTAKIQKLK